MSGDGGRPLVTGFVQQSPTSSRNLASHHGPPMNGEHRRFSFNPANTPTEHACNTWRALYRGLDELRNDLMQHIHLENNVLFANALHAPALSPV